MLVSFLLLKKQKTIFELENLFSYFSHQGNLVDTAIFLNYSLNMWTKQKTTAYAPKIQTLS